jgi:hypothetical protein
MEPREHYRALFADLEARFGQLDLETLTSVIGFSGGGPVSLNSIGHRKIFVTCELSLYPEQKKSSEGLKFELLSSGSFERDTAQEVLTALGVLSMDEQLGHGHTVDISNVSAVKSPVKVMLFSRTSIGNEPYGIYEVRPTVDDT